MDTVPKRHPVWTVILTLAAVIALVSAVGACASEDKPVGEAASTTEPAKTNSVTASSDDTTRHREKPNPDGTLRSNCDLQLPADFTTDNYGLFATAKLKNTGNVGIKVRITAVFDQVPARSSASGKS